MNSDLIFLNKNRVWSCSWAKSVTTWISILIFIWILFALELMRLYIKQWNIASLLSVKHENHKKA